MRSGRTIIGIAGLVLAGLLAACGSSSEESAATAGRGPLASRAGHYRISIRPEQEGPPRIGPLHAWLVSIESSGGEPVAVTHLAFDGGMPAHGHGFETRPTATDRLGDGRYRVDGVRFHMPGAWRLRVDVAGPAGVDFAEFDVEVEP